MPSQSLTLGDLVAIAQLMVNLISPLSAIASCINEIKSSKNIKNRLLSMIANNNQCIENENRELEKIEDFNDCIEFNNVSFFHNKSDLIFQNISLKIEKGNNYLVIGKSGSGKSTFCKLVSNYYDSYDGTITIDKTDYKNVDESSLANLFSIIEQNVFIFDGTIKENICLFKDIPESDIYNVMKLVGLNNMPLDKQIKDNGDQLSGGERQRIAIARALVTNREIIILDEATSSLNADLAKEILSNILFKKT